MTEAQELHDQIMRALISKYCGHEVTTEGDSFIISFHNALDAAAWALHVQVKPSSRMCAARVGKP